MVFYVFLTILLTLFASAILLIHRRLHHWESRGVPFITARFPFGNVGVPFIDKTGIAVHLKCIYDQFKKRGVDYGGFYAGTTPILLAVHPAFIKTVLVKEFHHFNSQGNSVDEKSDPLSANVFTMNGQEWKDMRVKLTPTFTTGKLKKMVEILVDCGKVIDKDIGGRCDKPIDIKHILKHFTINASLSCLLGLNHKDLETINTEFITATSKALETTPRLVGRYFLSVIAPSLIKLFKFKLFSDEVTMPFFRVVKEVIASRKSSGIIGNDIIQVLMDSKGKNMTAEQITAQAFAFFLGGFESTVTTLSYCLYELARQHDVQHRIRQELEDVTKDTNGKLTYNGIMQMEYLDQVIKETLRMYPVVPTFRRVCTADFTLPNKTILKRGSSVFVSPIGLHRDEEHFENPDDFKPDRFSKENRSKIKPFTYLPFGGGPKVCIGNRFATLVIKVGLVSLLKDYEIDPHKSLQYPMEFDNNSLVLLPRHDVILYLKRCQ